MAGMICGCCDGPPVPPQCVLCGGTGSGNPPADVAPYTDTFASVDNGWQLGPSYRGSSAGNVVYPPNQLSDYIRNGAAYAFKSGWLQDSFPYPYSFPNPRVYPPNPLPDTSQGRQPWIELIRRTNVYLPKINPRKYTWEIDLVYPKKLPGIDFLIANNFGSISQGQYMMALWTVAGSQPYSRRWERGDQDPEHRGTGFLIRAQGLDRGSDEHPSATLQVQLRAEQSVYETTVPFGSTIALKRELYRLDTTGATTIVSRWYLNGTLVLETLTSTSSIDCVRFCSLQTRLICYEPWDSTQVFRPAAIWNWWPIGGWQRGRLGDWSGNIYWHATNSPENELKFTRYAMNWQTL